MGAGGGSTQEERADNPKRLLRQWHLLISESSSYCLARAHRGDQRLRGPYQYRHVPIAIAGSLAQKEGNSNERTPRGSRSSPFLRPGLPLDGTKRIPKGETHDRGRADSSLRPLGILSPPGGMAFQSGESSNAQSARRKRRVNVRPRSA